MTHSTSTCCGTGKPRVRSGFVPPAHRLGVKERWEAGPPRCLLRRVGLVPTSVNFEGLTEWVWRPPAGGLKSGGPTALPPPSIPAKVPRGPWDRRQLLHVRHEEVFRMTASFTEQMVRIYTHLGMLSRGFYRSPLFSSSPRRKSGSSLGGRKLDSGFRRNDEGGGRVMRGLDPRISSSSP